MHLAVCIFGLCIVLTSFKYELNSIAESMSPNEIHEEHVITLVLPFSLIFIYRWSENSWDYQVQLDSFSGLIIILSVVVLCLIALHHFRRPKPNTIHKDKK